MGSVESPEWATFNLPLYMLMRILRKPECFLNYNKMSSFKREK